MIKAYLKSHKKRGDLFYMIDEKYRNRGYTTQCTMELINYAFEEMEYDISFYENGDYIFTIDREAFIKG